MATDVAYWDYPAFPLDHEATQADPFALNLDPFESQYQCGDIVDQSGLMRQVSISHQKAAVCAEDDYYDLADCSPAPFIFDNFPVDLPCFNAVPYCLSIRTKQSTKYRYPDHPTADDWFRIKPVIVKLYSQGKKQTEIQAILENKYGFKATLAMYKKRIATWGIARKLTESEVVQIIGKLHDHHEMDRSRITILLRGRPVSMHHIQEYQRRKRLNTAMALQMYKSGKLRAVTDLRFNISCSLRNALVGDEGHENFETLLKSYETLILGSVDQGLLILDDHGMIPGTLSQAAYETEKVYDFVRLLRSNANDSLLKKASNRVVSLLPKVLDSISFIDPQYLVMIMGHLLQCGFYDASQYLHQYLQCLLKQSSYASRPLGCFVSVLAYLPLDLFNSADLALVELDSEIQMKLRPGNAKLLFQTRASKIIEKIGQGLSVDLNVLDQLIEQGLKVFDPLNDDCLLLLARRLSVEPSNTSSVGAVSDYIDYLLTSDNLSCCTCCGIKFDDERLSLPQSNALSSVYWQLQEPELSNWIDETVLECSEYYELNGDDEYFLISRLEGVAEYIDEDKLMQYRRRKEEIEAEWEREVVDLPTLDVLQSASVSHPDAASEQHHRILLPPE